MPAKLIEALDITTQLAMAAGLDALREAGIPLVQTYRTTSKGTYLPDRWMLPEALRDETGVIFASAFPGGDRLADEFSRFYEWENRRQQIAALEDLRQYTTDPTTLREIMRRIGELQDELDAQPLRIRPPLHLPHPGHGPQPVRRVHRRARAEHACQRRLRQHGPGRGAGRGLDSQRPLPPRHRDRRRRRDQREPDGLDRLRLPGHGRRGHRRQGRRGGAALRPPPPRHAAGHGRLRARGRERGRRARARHARHRRTAEQRDRQQRLPRHAPGCEPHLPTSWTGWSPAPNGALASTATPWRRRWSSSRTRPSRRHAAAAPRPR